jgi:hypothetical protein
MNDWTKSPQRLLQQFVHFLLLNPLHVTFFARGFIACVINWPDNLWTPAPNLIKSTPLSMDFKLD